MCIYRHGILFNFTIFNVAWRDMKNKYQSVENSNTICITFCNAFKERGSMIEREYAVGKE